MRALAVFLSATLAAPAFAQPAAYPDAPRSSGTASGIEPLVITAPHERNDEQARARKNLKRAQAAGAAVAASGTGLMTYEAFFAAGGPVGWAAGLVFLGGVTAYLAHRRLEGKDDFGPTNARPDSLAP